MPETKDIEEFLTQITLETAESDQKQSKLGVYNLMDDWFQPKKGTHEACHHHPDDFMFHRFSVPPRDFWRSDEF